MRYKVLDETIYNLDEFSRVLSDVKVSDDILLSELDRLYAEWKSEGDFYFFLEEACFDMVGTLKHASDVVCFFECFFGAGNRCLDILHNRQNKINEEKKREYERESRMREERRKLCLDDELGGCEFNADYTELIKYPTLRADKSYTVPKCVKSIGFHAFRNSYIEEVTLQEGVEVIDFGAFYGCQYLRKISMPNTLQKISEDAFWKCFSLQDIYIPKNVVYIGSGAFGKCHNLVRMCIPSKVKKLGVHVFEENSRLIELTLSEERELEHDSNFLSVAKNCERLVRIIFPGNFQFPERKYYEGWGLTPFEGCPCSEDVMRLLK